MSAAPVIVAPDVEAWVWANVRELGGVTSFAYTALQPWPGWITAAFIQVDARSRRRTAARETAERARQIVMSLADRPWADGTVCYVQAVEAPFWLPDDDGLPRYCARYEIRAHPRRDSGIQPARAAASRKEPR